MFTVDPKRTRNRGPVADNRSIINDSKIKSNGLNLPRELAAYQERPPQPLKMELNNATDYSRREGNRPLGDEYLDIDQMVWQAINATKLTTGDGLLNIDNVISVDPFLPFVTKVGQLDELTVGGTSTFLSNVVIPVPENDNEAVNVQYVKDLIPTAGFGLELDTSTNSISVKSADLTQLGTLDNLTVSGDTVLGGTLTVQDPIDDNHASTKKYVDDSIVPGFALSKNDTLLDVQSDQITRLGTLENLECSGDANFAGITTVQLPTENDHATNKEYVDSLVKTAGNGLVEDNNVFSIDPPSIIEVGILTSLTCAGPATFSEAVEIGEPSNDNHAATKLYVDESVGTAGTGLQKSGTVMNIDPDQQLNSLKLDTALITPLQFETVNEGDTVDANEGAHGLILDGISDLSALTVGFPINPVDGQHFSIHPNISVANFVASGDFVSNFYPPPSLTAGNVLKYIYSEPLTAWVGN